MTSDRWTSNHGLVIKDEFVAVLIDLLLKSSELVPGFPKTLYSPPWSMAKIGKRIRNCTSLKRLPMKWLWNCSCSDGRSSAFVPSCFICQFMYKHRDSNCLESVVPWRLSGVQNRGRSGRDWVILYGDVGNRYHQRIEKSTVFMILQGIWGGHLRFGMDPFLWVQVGKMGFIRPSCWTCRGLTEGKDHNETRANTNTLW